MRLEFQDGIDRYLLNRMSDEERTSFEAKCAETPELKEQLDYTRDVRTVISEKSKMLARIQQWDDEYEEERRAKSRKKRIAIYWVSGIAATFAVGSFLFSPSYKKLEDSGDLASINQEENNWNNDIVKTDTIVHERQVQENLLAQNEVEEQDWKPEASTRNEERIFSFGSKSFEISNSPDTNRIQQELRIIEEEKCAIAESIINLNLKLKLGEISLPNYNKKIEQLNLQSDQLLWREATNLLCCGRRAEALIILDELRRSEGQYRSKADSMLNELSQ